MQQEQGSVLLDRVHVVGAGLGWAGLGVGVGLGLLVGAGELPGFGDDGPGFGLGVGVGTFPVGCNVRPSFVCARAGDLALWSMMLHNARTVECLGEDGRGHV